MALKPSPADVGANLDFTIDQAAHALSALVPQDSASTIEGRQIRQSRDVSRDHPTYRLMQIHLKFRQGRGCGRGRLVRTAPSPFEGSVWMAGHVEGRPSGSDQQHHSQCTQHNHSPTENVHLRPGREANR